MRHTLHNAAVAIIFLAMGMGIIRFLVYVAANGFTDRAAGAGALLFIGLLFVAWYWINWR